MRHSRSQRRTVLSAVAALLLVVAPGFSMTMQTPPDLPAAAAMVPADVTTGLSVLAAFIEDLGMPLDRIGFVMLDLLSTDALHPEIGRPARERLQKAVSGLLSATRASSARTARAVALRLVLLEARPAVMAQLDLELAGQVRARTAALDAAVRSECLEEVKQETAARVIRRLLTQVRAVAAAWKGASSEDALSRQAFLTAALDGIGDFARDLGAPLERIGGLLAGLDLLQGPQARAGGPQPAVAPEAGEAFNTAVAEFLSAVSGAAVDADARDVRVILLHDSPALRERVDSRLFAEIVLLYDGIELERRARLKRYIAWEKHLVMSGSNF